MKKRKYDISEISLKILLVGLPILIISFIYLIISFSMHKNTSQTVLLHIYTPQLEHFMMSLTILILGAILFDITCKELNIKN